jgi:hypothetical protein
MFSALACAHKRLIGLTPQKRSRCLRPKNSRPLARDGGRLDDIAAFFRRLQPFHPTMLPAAATISPRTKQLWHAARSSRRKLRWVPFESNPCPISMHSGEGRKVVSRRSCEIRFPQKQLPLHRTALPISRSRRIRPDFGTNARPGMSGTIFHLKLIRICRMLRNGKVNPFRERSD